MRAPCTRTVAATAVAHLYLRGTTLSVDELPRYGAGHGGAVGSAVLLLDAGQRAGAVVEKPLRVC